MKARLLLVGAGFALLVVTSAWLAATPDDQKLVPALVAGLVVMGGGLGALILRRRQEGRDLSSADDSFERHRATDAQAKTFVDALVLGVVITAVVLVFDLQAHSGVLLLGFLLVLVVDFFVRFKVMARVGG